MNLEATINSYEARVIKFSIRL